MSKRKPRPTRRVKLAEPTKPLLLDLGCGKNKRGPEWTGVDSRPFEGVDVVHDLTKRWPWKDASVDEVHCSHFLEHLDAAERVHFANELFRVLKPGGKCTIIVPHWASQRAYGDLTHKWPPVVGFWFSYLNKAWRDVNAPHNDEYTCDFALAPTWNYTIHPTLVGRNDEYIADRLAFNIEAGQDMIATLTKPSQAG